MERKCGRRITVHTENIIIKLLAISIIPFTLITCFSPWIFQAFFEPEWIQSGTFARYHYRNLIFRFIYSPISDSIFNVFKQQKLVFRLEVSLIMIVVLNLFIAYIHNFSATGTIIIYSLAFTVQYIIFIIFVILYSKKTS